MRFLILSFILFVLFSCQNSDKNVQEKEHLPDDVFKNWNNKVIKNVSFKFPKNLKVQPSFSSNKKMILANENSSLMLIIAFDSLKPENRNTDIYQIVDDIDGFGKGIHLEEKQIDNDLGLLSTKKSKLGNLNSILITQSSFELSGLSRPIIIKKHFCTWKYFLFKITVLYPKNSSSDQQLMNRVLSSFKFN